MDRDANGPTYAAELSGSPVIAVDAPAEHDDSAEQRSGKTQQPTKTAGGAAEDTSGGAWLPQSAEEWAEMHPSGKQHTFNAAASTFSFDPRPKHLQDMSVIHHPGVGGWVLYLQRGTSSRLLGLFNETQNATHN
jgi:hypothetical protein